MFPTALSIAAAIRDDHASTQPGWNCSHHYRESLALVKTSSPRPSLIRV